MSTHLIPYAGQTARPHLAPWTEQRVERLKELWRDGYSAGQIAPELGGVTRNAVIGKLTRLGLSGQGARKHGQHHPTGPRPQRRTLPHRPKAEVYARTFGRPDLQLRPANIGEAPKSKRLTILQLTDKTCKWPIGDPGHPDFHFCGHDSWGSLPYCEYHCGVAYPAPEPRRRLRA